MDIEQLAVEVSAGVVHPEVVFAVGGADRHGLLERSDARALGRAQLDREAVACLVAHDADECAVPVAAVLGVVGLDVELARELFLRALELHDERSALHVETKPHAFAGRMDLVLREPVLVYLHASKRCWKRVLCATWNGAKHDG